MGDFRNGLLTQNVLRPVLIQIQFELTNMFICLVWPPGVHTYSHLQSHNHTAYNHNHLGALTLHVLAGTYVRH